MVRTSTRSTALLVLFALACRGGEEPRNEPPAMRSEDAAISPAHDAADRPSDARARDAAPALRYEASTAGLRELVEELVEAARSGDRRRAYRIADSMRVDNPTAYFTRIFGPEMGNQLASDYGDSAAQIRELVPLLRELADAGKTEIRVERFTEPSDRAVGYQSRALERMVEPTPLYSVRLVEGDGEPGFHLWSFVHDEGSFRWVGKMRRVAPGEASVGLPEDLPDDAEIPRDAGIPDRLELPGSVDVRGDE